MSGKMVVSVAWLAMACATVGWSYTVGVICLIISILFIDKDDGRNKYA